MSKTKREFSLILAIFAFLIFCCGTICQQVAAVALVDDALIAIIIAALAAIGITFVSTGAYDTLEEYVGSLLQEYAESRGMAVSSLFSGTQSGVDKLGRIILNNTFVKLISAFGAWLVNKFSMTSHSSIPLVSPGISLGNCVLYGNQVTTASYGNTYTVWTFSAPVYICITNNRSNSGWWLCVISNTGGTVSYVEEAYNNSNGSLAWSRNHSTTLRQVGTLDNISVDSEYWWQTALGLGTNPSDSNTYVAINNYQDLAAALNNNRPIDYNNVGIDVLTDGITLPLDDQDYTEGDGAIIDVGADWGDTYDGVIDTVEGDWTADNYGDPTITYEGEETVQDQIVDTPSSSISSEVTDYQVVGLQDVFPFCIPFDIYSFFECLAADPVAPVVNWRFYVPDICDETITLDLSQFDAVAQIVRTMELLAFIVGLALVTREKFLRG